LYAREAFAKRFFSASEVLMLPVVRASSIMNDKSPVRMLQHKILHVRITKGRKCKRFKLKNIDILIVNDHWQKKS
jgi:hypothetical protein